MINWALAFLKGFKSGEVERIFGCVYAYFFIGYLILFAIYEQKFINLELSTQIFLSIAISFPITTMSTFYLTDVNINESSNSNNSSNDGFFYKNMAAFYFVSCYYSTIFSLFYLGKNLDLIDSAAEYDPAMGLFLILSYFIILKLFIKKTRPLPISEADS